MRLVLAAALVLAACDGPAEPPSALPREAQADPALQSEAGRACAEITGYSQGTATTGVAREMIEREYKACIAAVTGGEDAASAAGPALRGRADADPAAPQDGSRPAP